MHSNGWVASYHSLIKSDRKSQGIATSSFSLILMRTITLHYPQKLKRKKNTESKHRKEILCRSEGIPIASPKKSRKKQFLGTTFCSVGMSTRIQPFPRFEIRWKPHFFFFFFFSFISLIFPPTQNQGETFIADEKGLSWNNEEQQ